MDVTTLSQSYRCIGESGAPIPKRLRDQSDNHPNTRPKESQSGELDRKIMLLLENNRERLECQVENPEKESSPDWELSGARF